MGYENISCDHVSPCGRSSSFCSHQCCKAVENPCWVCGVFCEVNQSLRRSDCCSPPNQYRAKEEPWPLHDLFRHFMFRENQHSKPERSNPHRGEKEGVIVHIHAVKTALPAIVSRFRNCFFYSTMKSVAFEPKVDYGIICLLQNAVSTTNQSSTAICKEPRATYGRTSWHRRNMGRTSRSIYPIGADQSPEFLLGFSRTNLFPLYRSRTSIFFSHCTVHG